MFNPDVPITIDKQEAEYFLKDAIDKKLTHMYVAGWFLDRLGKNNLRKYITKDINSDLLIFLNKEIPFIELFVWQALYTNAGN